MSACRRDALPAKYRAGGPSRISGLSLQKKSAVQDILLIFIKNPRSGRVKTRLARSVGDAEALRIYRFLLDKTRLAAQAVTARRWLFYSDTIERSDDWPAGVFEKFAQQGEDLGERMADAFQRAFAAGAGRVVIIGSDCPELDAGRIAEAFSVLVVSDVVLGPTPDGGYYLLGMKQFTPEIFRNVAWSTAEVLSGTLDILAGLGKKTALLPALSDIDTEADWKAFQERRG